MSKQRIWLLLILIVSVPATIVFMALTADVSDPDTTTAEQGRDSINVIVTEEGEFYTITDGELEAIKSLAERMKESNPYVSGILYSLAGSILDGSLVDFAKLSFLWSESRMRVNTDKIEQAKPSLKMEHEPMDGSSGDRKILRKKGTQL